MRLPPHKDVRTGKFDLCACKILSFLYGLAVANKSPDAELGSKSQLPQSNSLEAGRAEKAAAVKRSTENGLGTASLAVSFPY